MGCSMKCMLKWNQDPTPQGVGLDAIAGEFWQPYGYNKLFDCYPCQHIHEMKLVNDSTWRYIWSYEVYRVNDSLKILGDTWYIPNVGKGVPTTFSYMYLGTAHNETWTVLDSTDRYALIYVCSLMFSWTNVGSIIWTKPDVILTEEEMINIKRVYDLKLGWNFPTDFCTDDHDR